MTQSNNESAHESALRDIGMKIRRSIRRDGVHFKEAGDHLDSVFDEDAVRQKWSEREDMDLEVLDRVSMYFTRFDLATGHYLREGGFPERPLTEAEQLLKTRTILLLTWLITDRETEKMKPVLTDLQYWPWGIDSHGMADPVSGGDVDDTYNRYLARVMLLKANGPAWVELAAESWRVHEWALAEHTELSDAQPAIQRATARRSKREPKYKRIVSTIEKFIEQHDDRPMPYATLSKLCDKADPKTIKKAIQSSAYLKRVYKDWPPEKAARKRPIAPGVLEEATPQSREADPSEAAERNDQVTVKRLGAEEQQNERPPAPAIGGDAQTRMQQAGRKTKKAKRRQA